MYVCLIASTACFKSPTRALKSCGPADRKSVQLSSNTIQYIRVRKKPFSNHSRTHDVMNHWSWRIELFPMAVGFVCDFPQQRFISWRVLLHHDGSRSYWIPSDEWLEKCRRRTAFPNQLRLLRHSWYWLDTGVANWLLSWSLYPALNRQIVSNVI